MVGAGPGAHGHIGDIRCWNVKHPNAYATAIDEQRLPVAGYETLSAVDRHTEEVMLGLRLRQGLATALLNAEELRRAQTAIGDGLLIAEGSGWCSPTGAGCWPTRWCAPFWAEVFWAGLSGLSLLGWVFWAQDARPTAITGETRQPGPVSICGENSIKTRA